MAHGHAAPAAVKNALYDVVTRHFNGEMDCRSGRQGAGRSRRRRQGLIRKDCGGPGCRPGPPLPSRRTMRQVAAELERQRSRLQEWLPRIVLAPSFAADPAVRLRLHPVHRGALLHRIEAAARPDDLGGPQQLCPPVQSPQLVDSARQSRRSSVRSTSSYAACSASGWPSCSTRKSAARAFCARSTSIPWRCPSSSPASPGSGFSIPASASNTSMQSMGLGVVLVPLDQGRPLRHLHRSSSPRSGSPPASSWRCSSPASGASTMRSSRPPRSTARRTGRSIAASSFR